MPITLNAYHINVRECFLAITDLEFLIMCLRLAMCNSRSVLIVVELMAQLTEETRHWNNIPLTFKTKQIQSLKLMHMHAVKSEIQAFNFCHVCKNNKLVIIHPRIIYRKRRNLLKQVWSDIMCHLGLFGIYPHVT